MRQFILAFAAIFLTGGFKKVLRQEAKKSNKDFDEHALGPQDRLILADDFWVTYDNFTIVESKWSEKELMNEIRKNARVMSLCQALYDDPEMRKLHDQCHRIAWRDSQNHQLFSQKYRHIICCKNFPNTSCGLKCNGGKISIDEFAKSFFGEPPSHCLPSEDFQVYLRWLSKIVTGTERSITVLALKPNSEGVTIVQDVSLEEFCKTLPPTPSNHPRMRS